MERKEFLKQLQEKLEKGDTSPDVEIEIDFFKDDGNQVDNPKVLVKYHPTETDVRQKVINITEDMFSKTVDDAYNYITFQIQQFEEEIDSVEFGGE